MLSAVPADKLPFETLCGESHTGRTVSHAVPCGGWVALLRKARALFQDAKGRMVCPFDCLIFFVVWCCLSVGFRYWVERACCTGGSLCCGEAEGLVEGQALVPCSEAEVDPEAESEANPR